MATSRAETLEVIYEDDDEGAVSSDDELEEDDEDDDACTSLHGHPDHVHEEPLRSARAKGGENKGDGFNIKERSSTLRAENKKLRAHLAVLAREVERADTEMDRWRARCRRMEEERDILRKELDRLGIGNGRSIAGSSSNSKDSLQDGVLVYATPFDREPSLGPNGGDSVQLRLSSSRTPSSPPSVKPHVPVLPSLDLHRDRRKGEKDAPNAVRESVLYSTGSAVPTKPDHVDKSAPNDEGHTHTWPANLTALFTRAVENTPNRLPPSGSGFMFESAYPNPNGHGEREIGWEPSAVGGDGLGSVNPNGSRPSINEGGFPGSVGVGFAIPSNGNGRLGHSSPTPSPSTSIQPIQAPRRKSAEERRVMEQARSVESISLSRSGSTSSTPSVSLSRAGSLSRGSDSLSRSGSVSSMSSNSHSHPQAPRSRPQSYYSSSVPSRPPSNHSHILSNRTSLESVRVPPSTTLSNKSSSDNLCPTSNLNPNGRDIKPISDVSVIEPPVDTKNDFGGEDMNSHKIRTAEGNFSNQQNIENSNLGAIHNPTSDVTDRNDTCSDSNTSLPNFSSTLSLRDDIKSNNASYPSDGSSDVATSLSRSLGGGADAGLTDPGSVSLDGSFSAGNVNGHEDIMFLPPVDVSGRPHASSDSNIPAGVSAMTNQLSTRIPALNSNSNPIKPRASNSTDDSQSGAGRGVASAVQSITNSSASASFRNSNVPTSSAVGNAAVPFSHPSVGANVGAFSRASATNIDALPLSINVGGRNANFTSDGSGSGSLVVNGSHGSVLNGDSSFVSHANVYSATSSTTPFSPSARPFSPTAPPFSPAATPFSPAGGGFSSDPTFSHRANAPSMTFSGGPTTFVPSNSISPYQPPLATPLLHDDPEYGPVIVHGPLPPRHMQYGQPYQTSGGSISNAPPMRRKREPVSVPPRHLGLAGGGVGNATRGKGGGGYGYEGDLGSYGWRDR
ncbi:hypothetical protein BU17DRAFT_89187 [Hysterangium stoloniferum]|nr:hypothetical protein BU17DRAFT_89187 [Hysterangium stoloniferum]